MSTLDRIFRAIDLAWPYQVSDYATNEADEKRFEADGRANLATAKQAVKALFLDLIAQAPIADLSDPRLGAPDVYISKQWLEAKVNEL